MVIASWTEYGHLRVVDSGKRYDYFGLTERDYRKAQKAIRRGQGWQFLKRFSDPEQVKREG